MTVAKLNSIAPWFGGKRKMGERIAQELGPHVSYYEPFCGSMAVLFAKTRSSIETVNDLHADLINLAMVLASERCKELYEAAHMPLLCQASLDAMSDSMLRDHTPPKSLDAISDTDILRAARFLALSWMCRNGVSGTARINYQMAARWTSGGGGPGTRWRSAIDSIPAWHDRLRGVVIMNRDAFDVISCIDDATGTVIYVDPPYFEETMSGSARYLHRFNETSTLLFGGKDDHERLAAALGKFKYARVVLSYYNHPRLKTLYADWTHIDCATNKNLSLQNRRSAKQSVAPEVLVINGVSLADAA